MINQSLAEKIAEDMEQKAKELREEADGLIVSRGLLLAAIETYNETGQVLSPLAIFNID